MSRPPKPVIDEKRPMTAPSVVGKSGKLPVSLDSFVRNAGLPSRHEQRQPDRQPRNGRRAARRRRREEGRELPARGRPRGRRRRRGLRVDLGGRRIVKEKSRIPRRTEQGRRRGQGGAPDLGEGRRTEGKGWRDT